MLSAAVPPNLQATALPLRGSGGRGPHLSNLRRAIAAGWCLALQQTDARLDPLKLLGLLWRIGLGK